MASKLRIGFIGAGGMGVHHYKSLAATKKAVVVALTEPSEASIQRMHEHCEGARQLPVYDDYRKMLRNEDLDAVLVLSPHTLHYEQINASLDKGLHVLTEKPMVCTIRHAKALIKKAKAINRILMIHYQRHFAPEFRYMHEQIAKGAIGEVQFVQAIQAQGWLYGVKGTWRQQMALSGGGQLNDSGSHLVDIIMWVTGMKVREVFAKCKNYGTEVDIDSTLAMSFENGALGSMSVIGSGHGWYEDHTIVGTTGSLYLRQGLGLIQVNAAGQPQPVKLPKYTKSPHQNFIDSILGKDEPQTPPECGLRTIEVTEAAWKSAATGMPVKVPG